MAWHAMRSTGAAPTEADQFRMQQGQEVSALARKQYPEGVMVPVVRGQSAADTSTKVLADSGKSAFFEATVQAGPFVAKSDILRQIAHDAVNVVAPPPEIRNQLSQSMVRHFPTPWLA